MFNVKGYTVVRTYNGKRGCMCGCNGNYNEDPNSRASKARVAKVMKFVGPVRPNSNDKVSYSTEAFGGERYVAVDEGDRTFAVYFK